MVSGMTPIYLRALQRAILASDACMAVAVTPDMPKVADAPARDKQVADIINAAGWGATSRAVESWQAKKLLIKRGKWLAITKAAADADHPAPAWVRAVLAHIVSMGVQRITAPVHEANAAVRRVLARLGAEIECVCKLGYEDGDMVRYVVWTQAAAFQAILRRFGVT